MRKDTQVELSLSEARALGITAPVRESGDLKDAGKCTIIGPKGEVVKEHAAIAAKRHIHMTPEDAKNFNVNLQYQNNGFAVDDYQNFYFRTGESGGKTFRSYDKNANLLRPVSPLHQER